MGTIMLVLAVVLSSENLADCCSVIYPLFNRLLTIIKYYFHVCAIKISASLFYSSKIFYPLDRLLNSSIF